MAESSSTTAPVASSSEVRSFYSKSYSTPGSVNVCDCIEDDDAQIALLDLILILDNSTGNYQEMMFIPPDNNWINPNHPSISFRPRSQNSTLRSSLLVGITHRTRRAKHIESFPSGSRIPQAGRYSLESFCFTKVIIEPPAWKLNYRSGVELNPRYDRFIFRASGHWILSHPISRTAKPYPRGTQNLTSKVAEIFHALQNEPITIKGGQALWSKKTLPAVARFQPAPLHAST